MPMHEMDGQYAFIDICCCNIECHAAATLHTDDTHMSERMSIQMRICHTKSFYRNNHGLNGCNYLHFSFEKQGIAGIKNVGWLVSWLVGQSTHHNALGLCRFLTFLA